ncbi:MAG: homocysteine S-methyltransferase family protein, partial [Firmicutes bacterium]|nr:homocysteine S-methyltransferase family protein [Bacillota bacterium]
ASEIKLAGTNLNSEEVIRAALKNARAAIDAEGHGWAALDIGALGRLLKPLGELSFDEAYETFAKMCKTGEESGADLVLIETMGDLYELKAAVLAAKENTSLPVFATVIFGEDGRLLTGADVPGTVALLEGLRVDALGLNCGLGPAEMRPLVKELLKYASVPVIVNPNAGLPVTDHCGTHYPLKPEELADFGTEFAKMGVRVLGGCCGTTPEHIAALNKACRELSPLPLKQKNHTLICSFGKTLELGIRPVIIGERINPTGKKLLKEALLNNDMDYIMREAISQENAGADALDVNTGLPGLCEKDALVEALRAVQSVSGLPLQLDTADPEALEAALRAYNGKPLINSVNGKKESLDAVLPLVKKYGGVLLGLCLDEKGIPDSAEERVEIAKRIINEAKKIGIPEKDVIIDPLTLAVSADKNAAKITLSAVKMLSELGIKTVLGVSNISFGLPARENINAAFYTMALQNGLSAAILNPLNERMMEAHIAFCALNGLDEGFEKYIS